MEDMEEKVIPDIINYVVFPQVGYPVNLVLISQLELCQEWGVH